MLKQILIRILKAIGLYKTYKVPEYVKEKYININSEQYEKLKKIITDYCNPEKYESNEARENDINALLDGRLNNFRKTHIPFLVETIGLKNKKVLEIGAGTGSSTLALAEQGAIVTGIDIDEKALEVAKKRLDFYGLHNDFLQLNARNIEKKFEGTNWDIVIFYAALEHMTPQERKEALSGAFSLLKTDGHLCVFGTPNRLWPFDQHTSLLPFFLWLQDDIAIDYSKFSPRPEFAKMSNVENQKDNTLLYRWGIGVSYHEFEIALKNFKDQKVIGSLPVFLRRHSAFQKISYKLSDEYRLKKLYAKFGPEKIHPGFYEPYLDLIIKKE